jgi:hypothetical protein
VSETGFSRFENVQDLEKKSSKSVNQTNQGSDNYDLSEQEIKIVETNSK